MKRHLILCFISCNLLLKSAMAEEDIVFVNLAAQNQQMRSPRVRKQIPFKPLARKPCPDEDTPVTCSKGVLPLNLENSSEIRFSWIASADNDKYLSIDVDESTKWINFNFLARYSCGDDSPYQEISGDDISVHIELEHGESLPSGFKLNQHNTEVALGKCIGCTSCQMFARIRYDLDGIVDKFSLNLYSISSAAKYDNEKVPSGSIDYVWDDRLRSIQFGKEVNYSLENRPEKEPASEEESIVPPVTPAPSPLFNLKLTPTPAEVSKESQPTPEVSASTGQIEPTDSGGYTRWFSSLLIANILAIVVMI